MGLVPNLESSLVASFNDIREPSGATATSGGVGTAVANERAVERAGTLVERDLTAFKASLERLIFDNIL
uniref:Uncharacterized protein n=1 Tax=Candidozyma auris TaxID=498019 RepID=A0A0L0P3D5_CANAR